MRKIIYLIEQPLDERNYARFGLQIWIDQNWVVEVWDLTPLAHPRVWKDFLLSQRKLMELAGYFPITSKHQLKLRYLALGQVEYFIDLTGENYRSLRVKSVLALKGAKRIICATGSIPVPESSQNGGFASKLRRFFSKGPTGSLNSLCMALARNLTAPLIKPDLAIVSGEISVCAVGKANKILKTHSFDYDIYLTLAKFRGTPLRDIAVFVDQDACFHSDFIYQGIPPIVTPEKYFRAICNGLETIARNLKVDVRIAAHPRASYLRKGIDYFRGMTIVYGSTADLIKDCRVVVCHDSTAIHFAVLFEKPMIFVTTDELIPTYEGRSTAQAASEFGKFAINLDRDLQSVDWQREMHINFEKYREYKNKYIKIDGTPERPMWEVVIDHLESTKKQTSTYIPDQHASVTRDR